MTRTPDLDLTLQQNAIRAAAANLLAVIDATVPGSTADYRIENARTAAASLARMNEPSPARLRPTATHDTHQDVTP